MRPKVKLCILGIQFGEFLPDHVSYIQQIVSWNWVCESLFMCLLLWMVGAQLHAAVHGNLWSSCWTPHTLQLHLTVFYALMCCKVLPVWIAKLKKGSGELIKKEKKVQHSEAVGEEGALEENKDMFRLEHETIQCQRQIFSFGEQIGCWYWRNASQLTDNYVQKQPVRKQFLFYNILSSEGLNVVGKVQKSFLPL